MESLENLLPQRAPMVLLSGYEEPSEENAVTAWVDVAPGSPFRDPALGGVPGCVALEYMAQAMALRVGLTRLERGLRPKLGFVLGSRSLAVSIPVFRDGARYAIHADCSYTDEEFASFDCEIRDEAGALVASGTITAFQPEGDVTLEKMKEFS